MNDQEPREYSEADRASDLQTIQRKIVAYRKLKVQADDLQESMNVLRNEVQPLVEAVGGKWEDNTGFARINERQSSVSYKNAEVENLVQAWLESGDPIMKSCANMLAAYRSERPGSTYFQIK